MSMSPGAFRANAPPLDVAAMERDLGRIPAVTSVRVVVEADELQEVHIVGSAGRSPKLIGRDVQSLLAARWGIDVDHRKVSVVQLDDAEEGAAEGVDLTAPEPPLASGSAPAAGALSAYIVAMSISVSGNQADASVTVALGDRQATGAASGIPTWPGQRRLAAAAAVEALASLDERVAGFSVADVTTVRVGNEEVVVTMLSSWKDGFGANVAGAAPVTATGELRAAAESVLAGFAASR
jgi:hypothetical protein